MTDRHRPDPDDGVGVLTGRTGSWDAARPAGPAPMSEWITDSVLLIGEDDGRTAAVAASLPAERDLVTVVSLLPRDEDWWWLADAVAFAAPPGAAVRLAVSGAGQTRPDRPAPAGELARRLRVDVLAPDGPLLLAPGGTAFVAGRSGPASPEPGRWLRFSPDGTVEPGGPRHPAPDWASGVDRVAGPIGPLWVTPVPCGLWVHAPGEAPARLTDLAYAVPADPHEVLLVVGAPGTAAPDPADVADVADELPANLAGRLVLVPHAGGSGRVLPAARELARRWQRPVTVGAGLSVLAADGSPSTVATDDLGEPCWRPLLPRLRVPAGDGPPSPIPPIEDGFVLSGLSRKEGDLYLLRAPWVVQVGWAGLWVRDADRPKAPFPLGDGDWDPRWLTVAIEDDRAEPALSELALHLPSDARARIRLRRHRPGAPS
jgi:hypothetical protein